MFSSLLPLLALAGPAFAQTQNITTLTSLLNTLQSLGLTSLVTTAGSINSTTTGQNVLTQLSQGGPFTLFAPNNNAFAGVPANITGNANLLADVIAYHVVPGVFNTTATAPSHTLGRTLLNDSNEVFLEGNKSQALTWTQESDGKIHILNQNTPATVVNSTTSGNLTIHVTDAVIDLPGDLDAAMAANNLTTLRTVLNQAGLFTKLNTIHGFTLFAPSDQAFSAAATELAPALSNSTLLATILGNHVFNSTTVYSTELSSTNETTASGEGISSTSNSTGTFVTGANTTAQITISDIILWNGVVHVIDAVLFNNQSNPSAASSAFQSATSAAASQSTQTGPIGGTGSSTGSGSGSGSGTSTASGSGSSQSSAASPATKAQFSVGLLGLVAGVFVAL